MRRRAPVFSCRSIPALDALMQVCGTCPQCGAANDRLLAVSNKEHPSVYTIECARCDYMGPWAISLAGAVRAWLAERNKTTEALTPVISKGEKL